MMYHRRLLIGGWSMERPEFTYDKENTNAPVDMDIPVDSVTLARLIDEVRNEDPAVGRSYDRVHHRHNR